MVDIDCGGTSQSSQTYPETPRSDVICRMEHSCAGEEFNQFMFHLKPNMKQFQPECGEFTMGVFNKDTQPVLSSIAKILGKEDDVTVDRLVLGMFAMMMKPGTVLDIPSFWQEAVKSQLMSPSLTGSFKFPSLIVYLFLYQNVEEFMQLVLNIMDVNKQKQ